MRCHLFLKRIFIILLMSFSQIYLFADQGMAPYILDGSFVLYFPNIKEASPSFRTILKKMLGIQYDITLSKIQLKIREKISANILDPLEAELLGIDPEGSMAYVHLRPNVGYSVFTVKNSHLLEQKLSALPEAVLYKIIDNKYVIFTSNLEVLEYELFKGVGITEEFKQFAKGLNFKWDQKFVWMTSAYLQENQVYQGIEGLLPNSDYIAGVFDISDKNVILNLYTIYKNNLINEDLRKTLIVSERQSMSFLDFEFGTPAIVGHFYLNLSNFLKAFQQIDIADQFQISQLLDGLKSKGFDVENKLLPYLTGKLSYVVRSYNPLNKEINMTLSAELKNKQAVSQMLIELVRSSVKSGMKVQQQSLFTQNLYGWIYNDRMIWLGIVEDHFVMSTDQNSLIQLIQNIYNDRAGFINKQPLSFRQFISKKMKGGQTRILVSEFLNNILIQNIPFAFSFITTLDTIQWDYYIDVSDNNIGRHDVIIFNFI